jgi:hypothetical protein
VQPCCEGVEGVAEDEADEERSVCASGIDINLFFSKKKGHAPKHLELIV